MQSPVEIQSLLGSADPHPVDTMREHGKSPIVLTCEHAGRIFPRNLGRLGISATDAKRHIAWDIGIARVSRLISAQLDAPLVMQRYSRLVIDCNRQPHAEDFITTFSEDTTIPGNINLSFSQVAARKREIFDPYHEHIKRALDAREKDKHKTTLISMHSFTPVFRGIARPWHVGLLHEPGNRLARYLIANLGKEPELCIGDNQPYQIDSDNDYSLPIHGIARGMESVTLEIRQDLIAQPDGQQEWAQRIGSLLANYVDKHGG